MEYVNDMNTGMPDRLDLERKQREISAVLLEGLEARLPDLRTVEDLEKLEGQGYELRRSDLDFRTLNPERFASQRNLFGFFKRALAKEVGGFLADGLDITAEEVEVACVESSMLALELILNPPTGIEVCARNPKLELPQLARLLAQAKLFEQPFPFTVPCCPDTNQYGLGDGIGDVVPKGLDYCDAVRKLFASHGFDAYFDVQVADVEGLDPVILANSGETTESHFAKTGETIRKAQAEVEKRGHDDFIVVRSMQTAFTDKGMEYRAAQALAVERIADSQDRKVNKTIEGLLSERVRLGNFDCFDAETRRELVIAELAGYAAYGAMANGSAVILSPDAMSAIPAYHYSLDKPEQYSPVFYAR